MRTRQLLSLALAAIAMLAVTGLAWGEPFQGPPEDNPNITWETQFPYQRNIFLDFSVDPIGPMGAIPGAIYEGYDDPALWDSDYVEFTGDVEWNAEKQAVGIFNAEGNESGSLIIHIDNWVRDWPVKHLYDEVFLQVEDVTGHLYQDYLGLPPDYEEGLWWGDSYSLGSGAYWWQYWVEIMPNPPWEDKVILFDTTAGGSIYVTSVHIATECVPEPATMGLLALGGLALIRRRRNC